MFDVSIVSTKCFCFFKWQEVDSFMLCFIIHSLPLPIFYFSLLPFIFSNLFFVCYKKVIFTFLQCNQNMDGLIKDYVWVHRLFLCVFIFFWCFCDLRGFLLIFISLWVFLLIFSLFVSFHFCFSFFMVKIKLLDFSCYFFNFIVFSLWLFNLGFIEGIFV